MPEPSQLTIDSGAEPVAAPSANRAPGPDDQNPARPFPGPCDHPSYAVRDDAPYGPGCYCSLCGARHSEDVTAIRAAHADAYGEDCYDERA